MIISHYITIPLGTWWGRGENCVSFFHTLVYVEYRILPTFRL